MQIFSRVLLMSATLAMALIAGFFYAYGSSVLFGLEQLPAADAVRAMQSINAEVRNLVFAPSFFGALILTAAALAAFAIRRQWTVSLWIAVALASYGLAAFWVTLAYNVPLNETLARVDPQSADVSRLAKDYFSAWGRWNWIRTFASVAAVAALALAWRNERKSDVPSGSIALTQTAGAGRV